MPQKPYIGVTGFTSQEEVSRALQVLDGIAGFNERALMVGVLASRKTLQGQRTRYAHRYPRVDDIGDLFPPHRRAVNLIHYASEDRDVVALGNQLTELQRLGGRDLDGFQLNVVWPEPGALASSIKDGSRVVLQLNPRALEEAGNDPKEVATRLWPYAGLITDVLIDGSCGLGIPLDIDMVTRYLKAISAEHSWLGLGVAGRLSADNLDQLIPMIERYPNLSIDAESGVRTPDDHLDLAAMKKYIVKASCLFVR